MDTHSYAARFWSKVERGDGCWSWLASGNNKGYGQFTIARRHYLAHRVAYELAHGPIPEGLEIDHTCRNRRCVNPDHLEVVTHAENIRRRSPSYAPGLCQSGRHDMTDPANVRERKDRGVQCIPCQRERSRNYMRRIRASRPEGT